MAGVRIVIVDPDPSWPARYADERTRIVGALGDTALLIEHIGSTSVPGLGAKPIIDIALAVPDVDDDEAFTPALAAAGYHVARHEPGHRLFKPTTLDVHLHVYTAGVQEIVETTSTSATG